MEWLDQLPYSYLAPGHSYQRKKTALLLLSAVLETCTDTWSPDRRKGQPPGRFITPVIGNSLVKMPKTHVFQTFQCGASIWFCAYPSHLLHCFILICLGIFNEPHEIVAADMGPLIDCARQRGQWDFFCRTKQLVLISCLEDSTNEVELLHLSSYFVYILFKDRIYLGRGFLFFCRSGSSRLGYC